jgi:DEAD/DEAH box helicase domain-containing protein
LIALLTDSRPPAGGAGKPSASLSAAVYDGDTPSSQRSRIRSQARIILSNPDMLHMGILPYHSQWAAFLAGLRYVVIDELHTYRGVFGSHVANVLRRLLRLCNFYDSHPQVICTSATIANPQQLAERLIEQPVQLVERNGAARGEKHVILYNPPMVDVEHGLRRSAVLVTEELAARCILAGAQTIVFGRSRLTTELLLTYLRQRIGRKGTRLAIGDWPVSGSPDAQHSPSLQSPISNLQSLVRGYRGGYLPAERRAIEAGLRSGEVRAVVATNALELGIDIGQLQAAVLCGYPGTIASTWQQMGRAGRSTQTSLALMVATSQPLDQYIVRHPEFLFERSPESALTNPNNLMLLVDQVRCAAFELPFEQDDLFGACPFTEDVLELLAEQGSVARHDGRWLWSGASYPARQISLRSAGSDVVAIQLEPQGESPGAPPNNAPGAGNQPTTQAIIGEVDGASAQILVHDGAVYLHDGQSHLVRKLDLEQRIAHVVRQDVDFYTVVDSEVQVQVLAVRDAVLRGGAQAAHGDVLVHSRVTGYRRRKHMTHEMLGVWPLDYPAQTMETTAYWLSVSQSTQRALAAAGSWFDSENDYGPNWAEQRERVRLRESISLYTLRCSRISRSPT